MMKTILSAFFMGSLFGAGLLLSGMTNPQKVQGFLDVFGRWDMSLMFVMVSGIAVSFLAYRLLAAKQWQQSLLGNALSIPNNTLIDRPLVVGSTLFGIGWGLGGLCPGPALAMVLAAPADVGLFVGAMLLGMFVYDWAKDRA